MDNDVGSTYCNCDICKGGLRKCPDKNKNIDEKLIYLLDQWKNYPILTKQEKESILSAIKSLFPQELEEKEIEKIVREATMIDCQIIPISATETKIIMPYKRIAKAIFLAQKRKEGGKTI